MKLSFQKIDCYSRCGLFYYYKYVKEIKLPPTTSIALGKACHQAVETFYKEKQATRTNPPLEFLLDFCSDFIDREFEEGILFTEEEEEKGRNRVYVEIKNKGISVMRAYYNHRAIDLVPQIIEGSFELKLKGIASKILSEYDGSLDDVVLEGVIDLIDSNGYLFDLKIHRRPPSSTAADQSQQLTIYALGYKISFKELPKKLILDYLIPSTERMPARLISLETYRTEEDLERLLRRIVRIVHGIKQGVFIPPDQYSWACRYCGYRKLGICKEYLI